MAKTTGVFNGGWCAVKKIGRAVLPVFLAATLTFAGWMAHEVHDHACRLAEIEANRFTSADAGKLWRDVSTPPPWLIARLDGIEELLRDHMRWHADGRTE